MVSLEFDSKVNALYVRLKKGLLDREPLADSAAVDLDKNGKVIGL